MRTPRRTVAILLLAMVLGAGAWWCLRPPAPGGETEKALGVLTRAREENDAAAREAEKAREDLAAERRRSDERIRTAREDARRQVASLDLGGVVSGLLDELARIRAGRTSGDLGNP